MPPEGADRAAPRAAPRAAGAIGGASLVALWALVLAGAPPGALAAGLAVFLIAEGRRLPATPRLHLAAGLTAAAGLAVLHPQARPVLSAGLGNAGLLAGLFTALATLRAAAMTAPIVRRTGAALAERPPGQSYAALTLGAHVFGVVLSFGVINLLAPLVLRGRPADSLGPEGRRLLLAVLRGVAAVLFWSPLTLAFAFVSTGIAGVSWPPVLAAGGVLAAVAMAVGAWSERGPRGVSGAGGAPGLVRELGPMAALCGLFVAAVGATAALSGGRLIDAVLVAVPAIAALWLAVQSLHEGAPLGWLAQRAAGFAARDLPDQRGEIVVLCNAAFLGAVAARLAADTDLAAGLAGLPPAVAVTIPALATGVVVLLGLAGANPLLAVALVAAPLADPAALGLSPEVVATALIAGWALSVNVTVAGASVLMLAGIAGVSPGTMGRRWNGGYVLRVYTLLALCLIGAELVLGGGAR